MNKVVILILYRNGTLKFFSNSFNVKMRKKYKSNNCIFYTTQNFVIFNLFYNELLLNDVFSEYEQSSYVNFFFVKIFNNFLTIRFFFFFIKLLFIE